MPAAVRRPVLNTQQEFVPTVYPFQKVQGGMGAPIPTQFSGGVATSNSPIKNVLDEPVKQKDTSNLVPVVVNEGTSMAYTVMLDPENNSVHSDGSDISNMMLNNVDAEKIALEAANQQYRQNTVVDPYQEAEKDMGDATDKFNLAVQKELPAGGYLEEFTDAQDEATAILDQDVKPNVIDGVLNKTNTYRQAPHALEALEAQNPYEQLENKTFSEVEAILNAPTEDKPTLKNNQYEPINDMVAGENLFAYNDPDPVLTDRGKPKANSKGVLDTTSSNDRKGSAVSSNARGSMMPFAKINRNEALMRIGGAIVGGSSQGFSGAMKAATDEFGNIQDANRKAETDAFNKAEATRLAEARIQAQKDKADKNKKAMGMPSAVYKQAALTAITDIKGRLANESAFNPFDNNTGIFGYAMSHVAGTDAHDTKNAIDTIEASIGFDRLQKMRDDSPTGGALGQVSNIELALLRQSLGSLKQSSSREQFVKNLNSIEVQYKKAVAAVEAQQREWYRMQGVDVPEPKNNSAEPAVVGGYSIVTKQK
jgi:hypothetical protein